MQGNVAREITIGGAHGVLTLGVQTLVHRFAQNAPLQGEIAAATKVVRAVNRPTQGAMVHDHPVNILGVEGVVECVRLQSVVRF